MESVRAYLNAEDGLSWRNYASAAIEDLQAALANKATDEEVLAQLHAAEMHIRLSRSGATARAAFEERQQREPKWTGKPKSRRR